MPFSLKRILPHLVVILGFIIISLAYFSPVLQGKKIFQSDIVQYTGMSKQQNEFKKNTGEETYWTNAAFSGMPTYQLGARYPHNYIKKLDLSLRFLPRPADYLFLYLLSFYLLMLVLKVDFKLAVLGALAFGFSTYLIIILGVGHNSKALAIAYMPLVLSGIILIFRQQYLWGFLLTTIAMGLELVANHYQMTYYLMFLIGILGLAYFIDAYRKKRISHFFKSVIISVAAVCLAIGLNATGIMATQELVKESTRGPSELTINPDGTPKPKTSGLDKDYITQFSYGFWETFNLFIPRFMGGGNGEDVGNDSATYNAYRALGATTTQAAQEVKHAPMYWGKQPIVEAPAYVGAVILFLFVLGLFLLKGRLKWWLVSGSVFALLLSYGKNFEILTNFFIDYVPFYNKFRAVTSIQVLLELCIPILGTFALVRWFDKTISTTQKLNALKYTTLVTGGLALVFLLFKTSLFDFVGLNDGMFRQYYGQNFVDALKTDRKTLFTQDTLRTLILVLLSAGVLYLYTKEKLKQKWTIVAFAALILFDLVGVDRRYVNTDDFLPANQVDIPFKANAADLEILKDTTYYRVYDKVSGRAKPSYFHNSLDGYNAAELKRYREVFDFYIVNNNANVLNMLNTKYVVAQGENETIVPFVNNQANGHAWFIKRLTKLPSANQEILALDSLDNKHEAIYTQQKGLDAFKNLKTQYQVDTTASITLIDYKPNYLTYKTANSHDGFVVFSEIYYGHGWKTYIDGKETSYLRVDYTLRGLPVPAGNHTIEFKFDPEVVKTGSRIALASSVLFGLLLLVSLYWYIKKEKASA